MVSTRIIPCLLLRGNDLVKTIKFKNPSYIGDPINALKIFNEKEVDELIFLDITATREKRGPNFKLLAEISSECFMPLGYGGGIRTLAEIEKLFTIGIEKVVLNTLAFTNPSILKQAIEIFGGQSIVVSIDVKKHWYSKQQFVYCTGGRINTKIAPVDFAKKMEDLGVGEIILNSIDRDGTMEGFDIDLIKSVSQQSKIPIVAIGGCGSLQDLSIAKAAGADAVGAGSFFIYQKKHRAVLITYPSRKEIDSI